MQSEAPMLEMTPPRMLDCGDGAISVEFGDQVDPWLNSRVLALDAGIRQASPAGVIETVPTYRSLLIHFDPLGTDIVALASLINDLCRVVPARSGKVRRWRVPVVYGGAFGEDIEALSARHGLSVAELIALHSRAVYRVYMIGFMPGFAYLGGLDPILATPRREQPRMKIPAQSISIGGAQSAIGTVEGPSGWHLIGRTPARGFMRGRDPVFLYDAGDEIIFEPIDADRWAALDEAASRGEPVATWSAS